jgi:hypothetical protein
MKHSNNILWIKNLWNIQIIFIELQIYGTLKIIFIGLQIYETILSLSTKRQRNIQDGL